MNPPSSSEPIWGPPYDLHYTQGTSHEIPYPDHGILQRSSVVFPSSQNLQMMLLQQSQQSQNRPTLSLLHQNGILGDHRSFPSFPWDSSGNYEFLSGNYVKREDQALQLHMNHPQQYNEWIHGRIGLNLGGRTYFSAEDSYLARFGKRSRLSGAPIHVPHCQAEGCTADLSKAKHYHRRHKVCELHSKAPTVVANGQTQRFCQQCSRFHALSEFDDSKRSCRKRLADHNRRRRKPQAISAKPESSHDASEAAPSSDTKPALVLKANSSPSREDSEASKGSSAKKTQTEDNHPVNKHNQTVNSTLNPGDQQDNRGLTSNYNVINTNPTKLSLFSDNSGGLAKVNNNSIEQCSWLKSATTNSPNIRPVTKSQNFHDLISCTSGSRINTSFSANPSTNLSGSYLGHHHQQEQLDDHGRNALIFNENHGRLQRNYASQNHGECDDDSSNRQPKYQDMQSLRSFYASTGSLL